MIEQKIRGSCEVIELGLRGSLDQQWLPCGISYRWQPK